MNNESSSPDDVSKLINKILTAKDPATVGLRKIIRKKNDEQDNFPLRSESLQEFTDLKVKKGILSDDERRILELEKSISDLNLQIKKQQESANLAIQNAFSKGKSEGLIKGIEQGKTESAGIYEKKIDETQKYVSECLKKLEDSRHSLYKSSEHILLRLCIAVVKKVVASEVVTRPDLILSVVKKALTFIGDKERLIIRVSPNDSEIITGRKDFWISVTERLKDVTVEPDSRIQRGECIIESNTGTVDARFGVQFEELSGLIEKLWEDANSLTGNIDEND
jgi:flagellar assembly protein FliH